MFYKCYRNVYGMVMLIEDQAACPFSLFYFFKQMILLFCFVFSAWFYHSTFENSKSQKPAPKPLMSQIPGINGSQDDEAAGQSKSYFKDTDSKYVRLAKQGGRRGK